MQIVFLVIGTVISLILFYLNKQIRENNATVKKFIYKEAELIEFNKNAKER